jgi:DNA-3-methyladenine glycosylase II
VAKAKENLSAATRHLRRSDPVMRSLISQVGPFQLKLERNRFWMLVRSIISQQLSTSAARTIRGRIEVLHGPGKITAERFRELSAKELRGAGLSGQKAAYVADLTDAALTGRIDLRQIARKSDEEVIEELVQVKGIGRWTAQMFLIFSLGRLDVFPHDDLGVRAAIRNLYGLTELPDKEQSHQIAARWRPYASVASWYCWRSFEVKKKR